LKTVERLVNQDELYTADELFFCGTGAQISPIIEVDGRKVGAGEVGKVTRQLQNLYFAAARGDNSNYSSWVTPAY
jgi:branched-chain amino acid aminotransferase